MAEYCNGYLILPSAMNTQVGIQAIMSQFPIGLHEYPITQQSTFIEQHLPLINTPILSFYLSSDRQPPQYITAEAGYFVDFCDWAEDAYVPDCYSRKEDAFSLFIDVLDAMHQQFKCPTIYLELGIGFMCEKTIMIDGHNLKKDFMTHINQSEHHWDIDHALYMISF